MLGEVVTGAQPGRQSAEEITLSKSGGLAVEDLATADLVYHKAANTAGNPSAIRALDRSASAARPRRHCPISSTDRSATLRRA